MNWISVNDVVPGNDRDVLVFGTDNLVYIASFRENYDLISNLDKNVKFTHWCEITLPEVQNELD